MRITRLNRGPKFAALMMLSLVVLGCKPAAPVEAAAPGIEAATYEGMAMAAQMDRRGRGWTALVAWRPDFSRIRVVEAPPPSPIQADNLSHPRLRFDGSLDELIERTRTFEKFYPMVWRRGPLGRSGRLHLHLTGEGGASLLLVVDPATGEARGYPLPEAASAWTTVAVNEDQGVLVGQDDAGKAYVMTLPDGSPEPMSPEASTAMLEARAVLSPATVAPAHAGSQATLMAQALALTPTPLGGPRAAVSPEAEPASAARRYLHRALRQIDHVESQMAEHVRVAEMVVERYDAGGMVGFVWNGQPLQLELAGRAGGLMHLGFGRDWRPAEERREDLNVGIWGWTRAPADGDLPGIRKLQEKGGLAIGFGPRNAPAMAAVVEACDVFFDTGLDGFDNAVELEHGGFGGEINQFTNTIAGWVYTAEFFAAFTRRGKTPVMWLAWAVPEGRNWSDARMGKGGFHDDLSVAPIEPGALGRRFLDMARSHVVRFGDLNLDRVEQAAGAIIEQARQDRKTFVLTSGHMLNPFVARSGQDRRWAHAMEVHHFVDYQVATFNREYVPGALVLRMGYQGLHQETVELLREKNGWDDAIILTTEQGEAEWAVPRDVNMLIDMGYAWGDGSTRVEGYPVRLFPPSGFVQTLAYEMINVAVLDALPAE